MWMAVLTHLFFAVALYQLHFMMMRRPSLLKLLRTSVDRSLAPIRNHRPESWPVEIVRRSKFGTLN